MTGIDDNFEPVSAERGVEGAERNRIKRALNRLANVCAAVSVVALPVAIFYPKSWAPTATFTGFVLYLALKQLRHEI